MQDEYNFSNAKRAKDVPHLAKLRSESKSKTRITKMLDDDILETFKTRASAEGMGYQTLINQTLRNSMSGSKLDEATLRKVIREEISNLT